MDYHLSNFHCSSPGCRSLNNSSGSSHLGLAGHTTGTVQVLAGLAVRSGSTCSSNFLIRYHSLDLACHASRSEACHSGCTCLSSCLAGQARHNLVDQQDHHISVASHNWHTGYRSSPLVEVVACHCSCSSCSASFHTYPGSSPGCHGNQSVPDFRHNLVTGIDSCFTSSFVGFHRAPSSVKQVQA